MNPTDKINLNKKTVFLLLLGVVAIAAVMRLYHLTFQSMWVDEIASMHGSDWDLTLAQLIHYTKGDQPPAFFLMLHVWLKFFPFDDFSGRLLAVVIGLIGIIAVFFLGREIKDERTGLMASLIATFSYIHIYFSQEARFYTLVFLASSLSWLFFIRAVKSERKQNFLLYVLFTTLVIYTHYFGLVVLVSQGILFLMIIVVYKSTRRFIFLSITSAISIIVLISPWIPVLFSDVKTEVFWIPREPFYFPIKYFYIYFKDYFSCFVFAPLILYYFFNTYRTYRQEKKIDPAHLILIGSVILGFLIPITYSIVRTPMLQERYTIICLPSIIVMISLGFGLLKEKLRYTLLIGTCCTALISLIFIEKYYTTVRKEDWRGLAELIIRDMKSDEIVVSRHAWYCNYYFKALKSNVRAIQEEELKDENLQTKGIWYADGFDLSPEPKPAELLFLKDGFAVQQTDSLFHTRTTHYRKVN